jgi:hypothetical protein
VESNPTLRKSGEGWEPMVLLIKEETGEWAPPDSYGQGFTQKHPLLLHLKTNPGMQRITLVLDEIRGFLALGA